MAETLLIVFIIFVLLGMPISIALGVGALGAAMFYPVLNPIIIPTRFVGLLSDSFLLLSAPLFILAGNIAARGGVARVIIDLATALVGRFRGGLAYVNVVDSMFFGGISGSAVADVSALGTFLIPQMVRKGYDLDFATALTVSTAVVAPIIPPSIIAVIYAWMAEESVAAMFAAGVVPGLLVGIGMAVPVFAIARKRNYPKEPPPTLPEFMAVLRDALPALMIPVIIMRLRRWRSCTHWPCRRSSIASRPCGSCPKSSPTRRVSPASSVSSSASSAPSAGFSPTRNSPSRSPRPSP
jgi:tripartite ATP-independent transporter DctM subunit